MSSRNHYFCRDCKREFGTRRSRQQHYIDNPRHHYCRKCDTHFKDDDELKEHACSSDLYCAPCDQYFESVVALRQHNRQSHLYCTDCRRFFMSENQMREHKNSHVHQPKNIPCVFQSLGCTQCFVSRSAMISHLEHGSACVSGVDRDTIRLWARLRDERHVFTVPPRLLTEDDDEDQRSSATEEAWNGSAYECALCSTTFRTLDALNRHLASPRHQGKIYRCPLSICPKTFNTLGGVYRHVESESCGASKIRAVRKGMNQLLKDMRSLRN